MELRGPSKVPLWSRALPPLVSNSLPFPLARFRLFRIRDGGLSVAVAEEMAAASALRRALLPAGPVSWTDPLEMT